MTRPARLTPFTPLTPLTPFTLLARLARCLAGTAAALLLGACAGGPPASVPGCADSAGQLPVSALYGDWLARFDGGTAGDATPARVTLAPHPEYAGGVRGTIARGAQVAQLSGDIDDQGQLTLDESKDGRAISAVWSADMQPGSCGKEFKGTWRNASDDHTINVWLSRPPVRP